MIIKDIFEKSIDRPLEGVIKVGKDTEEAVYTNIREREDNCRTNQISERFLIFCLAAVFRIYGERFFRLSL